mmetsp:Transcript_22716/g.37910  ORF Transcript_22716/g.37910 Transcript_22716/m.37910 type:complete len:234 (-) Transcript_22716:376-1077(-)
MSLASGLYVFAQEAIATVLFFVLYFGILPLFFNSYLEVAVHYVMVLLFDSVTMGSSCNPACVIASLLLGDSYVLTASRLAGEFVGAYASFHLIKSHFPTVISENLGCPNPTTELIDLQAVYMNEFCTSTALTLSILYAVHGTRNKVLMLSIIFIAVRSLLIVGSYSGPGMNAITGLACWGANSSYRRADMDDTGYFNMYVSVPILGGVMGAMIWKTLKPLVMPTAEEKKAKND